MIGFIIGFLLGSLPQEVDPVKPCPARVEKRAGKWVLHLRVRGSLPSGAIVRVRIQPRKLRFLESRRLLEWHEPECDRIFRRAPFERGEAKVRTTLGVLRRVVITYSVDRPLRVSGRPIRKALSMGSFAQRLRQIRAGLSASTRMSGRLKTLLDQLKEAEGSDRPRARILKLVPRLLRLRADCRRDRSRGGLTATTEFLDTVAADGITYASWLTRRGRKNSPGGVASSSSQQDPSAMDKPGQGGGTSVVAPTGMDVRNIRRTSFARLRRRLDIFDKLQRGEVLMLLLCEVRELLKSPASTPKIDAGLLLFIDVIEERAGEDSFVAETLSHLRKAIQILNCVKPGKGGEASRVVEILGQLSKDEKIWASLGSTQR